MTTADKLLGIDAGKLEVLACAYLRKVNPELSQLIQTGLNEKGKTIKDPVDAFLKTTINGKLTFVLFEFTTQEAKDLETKWLKDTSTLKRKTKKSIDGDIIKTSKKAEKLRHNFPDAIFQIVICTNQRVSSSLLEKVYITCDKLNLKNEGVIEFSQIHSFLEDDPYGQWIRQKYLGIDANYLSPELLMWIGEKSLESYREEIFFSSNKSIIKRTVEEELKTSSKKESLIFLSAESGYGKSIVCYKLLASQLQKENFILRLNPTIVSQSSSLEHAVISQLKIYVPNLFTSHLSNIFETTKGKRIYIVIDDINKVQNPKEILIKIVSWSNKNKKSITQNNSTSYSIICPIWSKYSEFLDHQFQSKDSFYKIVELGRYSEDEAYNYIKAYFSHTNNITVTDVQVEELSRNLEFDPFLISRFCEYSTYIEKLQLSNKSQIIEKFVEAKIEERYSDKFLKVEILRGLKQLAFQMLKNKNIQPNFTNLTTWFGENNEDLKIIKELAKDGVLIRFSNRDNLLFRHDRIRDLTLILKIEELFQDDSWNEDILLDPYYSELLGQNICRQKQSKEKLKLIASRVPIALFESLKYLDGCEKSYQDLIVEIITSWIKEFVVNNKISKKIMDDIYWHLSSIDSKYLVQVTEEMPRYSRSINIARFRNGNVLALATYLTGMPRGFGGFAFTVGNPYLRRIITHSKKYFDCKLKQDLNIYLQHEEFEEKWREYIIQAAGMLEYSEYYNSIFICWKNSKEKVKLLAPTIWALLHCFNENDENEKGHLDTIINYWLENTEFQERDGKKIYGGEPVAKNVRRNCKNLSVPAIKKIESWIEKGFLEKCLALDLLTKLDIPWLVEKYISNPSYWQRVRSNNLSEDGLNFIKSKRVFYDVYTNKELDETFRKDALSCWITNVDETDLPEIKKLPRYSGSLYSDILFKRLDLKDNTVSQEVKPQIEELLKKNSYWIIILPKIWDSDVKDELLRHMNSTREILDVLEICYFIPKRDALEVLNKSWEIFSLDVDENIDILKDYLENYIEGQGLTNKKSSDKNLTFIGSNLITASLIHQNKELLGNIKSLCKKFSKPKPFFKHFPLNYFSIKEPTGWGAYKLIDRENLGLSEFEVLTPFLNYMPYSSLSRIINNASELGFFDWAKKNTYHLINHFPAEAEYSQFFLSPEFRSSYDNKSLSFLHFPTDLDIMDECHHFINQNEKKHLVSDSWLKRLEKRGCPKERLFNILINALKDNPSIDVFKFYCDCLVAFGTRSDFKNLKELDSKIDKDITLPLLKTTEYLVRRKRLN